MNRECLGRGIGIVIVALAAFGVLALAGLCLGVSLFVGARIL